MPTRYLILRANAPVEDKLEMANPSAWRRSRGVGGPTELAIDIVDGHETDAGALRADPRNVAVMDADTIFSLVKPRAKAAVDAQGLDGSLQLVGTEKLPTGLIAVGAHATDFTGQGVRVAVLDTGLDTTHPAFAGKEIVTRDFTGEGNTQDDVTDSDGHGTHCAGTICGAKVGDSRVGVAPGVSKLIVGKVIGAEGATLDMLYNGLLWATRDEKADIISLSLGFDLAGNTMRWIDMGIDGGLAADLALQAQNEILEGIVPLLAFLEAQTTNVLFVAATGNESNRAGGIIRAASLPASKMFAVGAVGPVDAANDKWAVAEFSNGRALVVGPGVDVVSAAPGGGWATMSGTSMATPHAAGVAALWVEKLRADGKLQVPGALRAALTTGTTRKPLVDTDPDAIGAGLVQAPAN